MCSGHKSQHVRQRHLHSTQHTTHFVSIENQDELGGEDRPVYKKVAVVEDFFDIIYREHVEFMSNSGGRPPTGKHAGQKRTYRAVS